MLEKYKHLQFTPDYNVDSIFTPFYPGYYRNKTGLPSGKTVWSTVVTTWSGQRRLANHGEDSAIIEAEHEAERVTRSLYTTVPNWCSFYGVSCTSASIVSIDISSLGLVGTLPSSIGDLHSLTAFDVSTNTLSGTIPSSIGDWNNAIATIKMHDNLFTGSIPSSVGTLRRLVYLDLSVNSLFGTIPSSFSALNALTTLNLATNFLTMGSDAAVPSSTFSTNTKAGTLDLSQNCLTYGSFSALHCRPSSQPTSRKFMSLD